MEWLTQNWFWVLFFGGMIAMHLFGHGGHGGHGGGSGGGHNALKLARNNSVQRTSEQGPGHHH